MVYGLPLLEAIPNPNAGHANSSTLTGLTEPTNFAPSAPLGSSHSSPLVKPGYSYVDSWPVGIATNGLVKVGPPKPFVPH